MYFIELALQSTGSLSLEIMTMTSAALTVPHFPLGSIRATLGHVSMTIRPINGRGLTVVRTGKRQWRSQGGGMGWVPSRRSWKILLK